MSFSNIDIAQIQSKGIRLEQVKDQVQRLQEGMSFANIIEAGGIENGIERFSTKDIERFIKLFETKSDNLSLLKFIPASGAATRMFKFLFAFLSEYNFLNQDITAYATGKGNDLLLSFIENIKAFPFYNSVINDIEDRGIGYNNLTKGAQCVTFVETMLDTRKFNYAAQPKGLLPFHQYDGRVVTAFQEHLYEASLYASSRGVANLHFTVSKNHHDNFKKVLNSLKTELEKELSVTFNVSFSYQKEETETLALKTDNTIFRNDDNSILFRPAGHGALIENLNDLDYDFIFIKNIDNITTAHQNIELSNYKKLLAGALLEVQELVFKYLNKIDNEQLSANDFSTIANFLVTRLNVRLDLNFEAYTNQEKKEYLKNKLNKPLRACGIVKNVGEPGGGPFWVKAENGDISLQIIEFAQIDFNNDRQKGIASKATHFSPTDLVCAVKNYKGEKFNLLDYVDPEAAFITMKTQNGQDIKALELPGLWNGSMAYWNSIYIEVPLHTFNPVKTVNDLLKPAHQNV